MFSLKKKCKKVSLEQIGSPWHLLECLTFCKYYLTFLHLCWSRSDNLIDRWKGLMAFCLSLVLLYLHHKCCFATLWGKLSDKSDEEMTVDLWARVNILFVCMYKWKLVGKGGVRKGNNISCLRILCGGQNLPCSSEAVCETKFVPF